jgi:alpha-ketoglutaric semialdehyde dehydrogenase
MSAANGEVTSGQPAAPEQRHLRSLVAGERVGQILLRTADVLEREAVDWGEELAREEGKTRAEGIAAELARDGVREFFTTTVHLRASGGLS